MDKINPGMLIRLCKASLVAVMALLLGLVAFNNIVDYGDNWTFVVKNRVTGARAPVTFLKGTLLLSP